MIKGYNFVVKRKRWDHVIRRKRSDCDEGRMCWCNEAFEGLGV